MLPQQGRLRRRADFQRAYEQGKRVTTPEFLLYLYPRGDEQPSHMGFVVGRRFGCNAERNRLKRRLRAVSRSLWGRMKPGYDLVLVARNGLSEVGAKPLEQRLEEVFQREGLLYNDERRSDSSKDVGK